ncbi:MAG: YhbY family RNA-binding protein [Deltaproteobacteria bacterium]|nr:YhbY family RNA-binding protein [Deltaproteobacteria bacterium]
MELTARQRQYLKGLGHHRKAVIHVGHHGITAELCVETGRALQAHELIKVKFSDTAPGDRREAAGQLARETGAAVAQVIGRVALLYKRREEDPEIVLPAASAARPARKAR